ncbi:hypothetical protein NEOKW01_0942 [Nematocida sp. AWRm80]|nr:hypothetical protein NEOKW01_0942 [Nematocida sp. AWRm80]
MSFSRSINYSFHGALMESISIRKQSVLGYLAVFMVMLVCGVGCASKCLLVCIKGQMYNPYILYLSLACLAFGQYCLGAYLIGSKVNGQIRKANKSARCYALIVSKNSLCLVISGISLLVLIKAFSWAFDTIILHRNKNIAGSQISDIMKSMQIQQDNENLIRFITEMVTIICGIVAIKNLIIGYTQYLLQTVQHRSRTVNNRFMLNIIEKLSMQVQEISIEEDISTQIFKCISNGEDTLSFNALSQAVGVEDATILFSLFDENYDAEISSGEFKRGYQKILEERENIATTKRKKDQMIDTLETVLSSIVYILSFVIVFYFLEISIGIKKVSTSTSEKTPIMGVFLGITTLMVSGIAIYGNVFNVAVSSIFFILLVKPFDIGDLIKFNESYYTVHSFGLMRTMFKSGEKYISIPNTSIMQTPIENLSRSLFYHGTFSFTIPTANAKEIISSLKLLIQEYIRDNYKFKKSIYIGNYSSPTTDKLHAHIYYILTCTYKDRDTILEREDELKLFVFEKLPYLLHQKNISSNDDL